MLNWKKYIDKKYNYIIFLDATDDVADEPWACAETEQEAKTMVDGETKAYDNPNYKFHYEKIYR